MSELEETLILAEKLLDEPNCDPDDDLRMLARQLTRRHDAVRKLESIRDHWKGEVDTLNKRLHSFFEGQATSDLIQANRDQMLKIYEEAVRRIGKTISGNIYLTSHLEDRVKVLSILSALSLFHPMHAESWPGWPEGSE